MATGSPTWVNACYLQKILRNAEKDETIEVSGVTVKPATAKGDNYASDMYRVAVEVSRVQYNQKIQEKKSLIVKVAPQGDMREQVIEDAGLFETELSMMSVTLPRMTEILENLHPTPLGAQCLYVQFEKPTHVLIEDLAPRGFRMAERRAGMDLNHCLLAMRNMARFHGASVALNEKDPNAFKKYTKGILRKDQSSLIGKMFNSGAKVIADETAKWPGLDPRITEKLHNLSGILFEKACEAALVREDEFNVLNHGDSWVNNMLFRYDEQRKPIDHIFVDFQLCHYGSPAEDILYFLGTSPTNEVRLEQRELLVHEYHASLTDTMVKLECKTEVPTFDKLQETLKNRGLCEVFAALSVLPGVVLEKGEEMDLNEMLTAGVEYENPSYRGKSYMKIMTRLLPWYDSMGFLDV